MNTFVSQCYRASVYIIIIDCAKLYHYSFRVTYNFRRAMKICFRDCSAVFCALHDQLASLGRHAQLTRCFSAVAEFLVNEFVVSR